MSFALLEKMQAKMPAFFYGYFWIYPINRAIFIRNGGLTPYAISFKMKKLNGNLKKKDTEINWMNLNISGYTKLLCLLGHPAKHSKSPGMHNEACSILNLDYCYLAFDIEPSQLENAINGLRLFEARGFNLTMPFKEMILPYMDELSKAAYLCQSVNTVVNENGKFYGHTTDGIGYMDSIKSVGFDIRGGKMTILGAGGAAKSILTQASIDGVKEIRVFKRKNATFKETLAFADRVEKETGCRIIVCDMADKKEL